MDRSCKAAARVLTAESAIVGAEVGTGGGVSDRFLLVTGGRGG